MPPSSFASPTPLAPPAPLPPAIVLTALRAGWQTLRRSLGVSLGYAGVFALIDVVAAWALVLNGLGPMMWVVAGGFLLVGPVLWAGFLGVSAALRRGRPARWADVGRGFAAMPRGALGLALVCVLLFLIWVTDAGILYSFMVGAPRPGWLALAPLSWPTLRFQLAAGVAGAFLAAIVFCVSAHAVPLLVARRATLVGAVAASVRAVFASPLAHAGWALLLAATMLVSIALVPLLLVSLPLMAYTGEAIHRASFPDRADRPGSAP